MNNNNKKLRQLVWTLKMETMSLNQAEIHFNP